MTAAAEIISTLESLGDERQRAILQRFFKTGKGEYGEGDIFLGIKVPQVRLVVKSARLDVPFSEIEILLHSKIHEVRLCGFLLLVEEMKDASSRRKASESASRRDRIARFYLDHARCANNWDLVDLSSGYIIGSWLLQPSEDGRLPSRDILDRLAVSDNLWEQRIAIVSTSALIRAGQFDDTLRIADMLLSHPHDLIHKAVGWMLREVGKRDIAVLRDYLGANYRRMARTTLRYAIERMSPDERRQWMTKS